MSAPDIIPAGGEAPITIRLLTEKLRGPITQGIELRTNDPTRSVVHLGIQATVRPFVEVSAPGFMRFGPADSIASSELVVHGPAAATLSLPPAEERTCPAQLTTVIPGRRYRLNLRRPQAASTGATVRNLRLRTTSPQHPEVDIPISVEESCLAVYPTALVFDPVATAAPGGRMAFHRLWVRFSDPGPHGLTLRTDLPGLSFQLDEPQQGIPERFVEVRYSPPGGKPEPLTGKLTLEVSGSCQRTLQIPVTINQYR